MIKTTIVVLAVLLLTCLPAQAQTVIRGDTNGDGQITIVDALLIAQYRALLIPESAINYEAAASAWLDYPVNVVTVADALVIAQRLAGLRDADYNWITQ